MWRRRLKCEVKVGFEEYLLDLIKFIYFLDMQVTNATDITPENIYTIIIIIIAKNKQLMFIEYVFCVNPHA